MTHTDIYYSTAGQELLRIAALQKNGSVEPPLVPFLRISNNPLLHMHLYIINYIAFPVFWAVGSQPSTCSCPPMQNSLFNGKTIKNYKILAKRNNPCRLHLYYKTRVHNSLYANAFRSCCI